MSGKELELVKCFKKYLAEIEKKADYIGFVYYKDTHVIIASAIAVTGICAYQYDLYATGYSLMTALTACNVESPMTNVVKWVNERGRG